METKVKIYWNQKFMKKLIFGLLIITAGLLLLALNIGFIPESYRYIIFSWQMLLVSLGLIHLPSKDWLIGLILILVGGFFLVPEILIMPLNFVSLFWPALLILIGSLILGKMLTRKSCSKKSWKNHNWDKTFHNETLETGYIDENHVFSGGKTVVAPVEFRGGKISCIFGGTEIDLTQTVLADGKNILDVSCVFGGVSLIVPSNWIVKIDASTVLGGFSDNRKNYKNLEMNQSGELIIKGSAVFGGGEIKSE